MTDVSSWNVLGAYSLVVAVVRYILEGRNCEALFWYFALVEYGYTTSDRSCKSITLLPKYDSLDFCSSVKLYCSALVVLVIVVYSTSDSCEFTNLMKSTAIAFLLSSILDLTNASEYCASYIV